MTEYQKLEVHQKAYDLVVEALKATLVPTTSGGML